MTNVQEHSSIDPHPNIFFSNSNFTSLVVIAYVMAMGFNRSKHTIKRGITTLASYSNVNQITFQHPTKLSTIHKALKCVSNMITIMLWTCYASKDFKKSKKSFITFITSSCIFLCRNKILASKGSKTLDGLKSYNNLASMFIVNVIAIV